MELVEYEDVAFESDILSSKTLEDDNEEIFQDLMDAMNMQNIAFIHKKTTSVVVFFYYEDGSVMNAYIDGNKMGLSYGSVWIKVKGFKRNFEAISMKEIGRAYFKNFVGMIK
jgi:hypothetical protein